MDPKSWGISQLYSLRPRYCVVFAGDISTRTDHPKYAVWTAVEWCSFSNSNGGLPTSGVKVPLGQKHSLISWCGQCWSLRCVHNLPYPLTVQFWRGENTWDGILHYTTSADTSLTTTWILTMKAITKYDRTFAMDFTNDPNDAVLLRLPSENWALCQDWSGSPTASGYPPISWLRGISSTYPRFMKRATRWCTPRIQTSWNTLTAQSLSIWLWNQGRPIDNPQCRWTRTFWVHDLTLIVGAFSVSSHLRSLSPHYAVKHRARPLMSGRCFKWKNPPWIIARLLLFFRRSRPRLNAV